MGMYLENLTFSEFFGYESYVLFIVLFIDFA